MFCAAPGEGEKKLDEAAMGNVLILELFFSHAVKGLYSMELYDQVERIVDDGTLSNFS